MATKYTQKFSSVSQLAGFAPNRGNAAGFGWVDGVLCYNDGSNVVPVGKTKPVELTAGATLTPDAHANRTIVVNNAAGLAIVLPSATATGNTYRVVIGTALSSGDVTVSAPSGSILKGMALVNDIGDSGAGTSDAFAAGASDEVFTFDQSAGGGKVGDWVEVEDIASGVYLVNAVLTGLPDTATPFSSAA